MSGVWSADLLGGSSSHVVPCGVVSERHGCTSTIHALTKSDVLLKPWRSAMLVKYTSRRVFGCGEAEIWCRNALVRRATAETHGAALRAFRRFRRRRHVRTAKADRAAPTPPPLEALSIAIPCIFGSPGDESTSTCVPSRNNGRVAEAPERFSKLATAGGQPTAPRHALHGKRRLHTTLHQTLDCRRLVFLGRRPLAVSTYQSQDP
ncbi:hypothetical protein D6D18_04975 [Aureobasidium pullulans]|nr:hypothetical protein D6D18_04975 [Aureobasidium pullulans]